MGNRAVYLLVANHETVISSSRLGGEMQKSRVVKVKILSLVQHLHTPSLPIVLFEFEL